MPAPAPVVLLIEDEPQMRRFLAATLHAHDYRVVEASSAKAGLAQTAGRNPDLVLLDLGLPDADGLDVARAIRQTARTPIIVLSARGQEHDKVAALDIGADDYLTKPFGVPELLARIRVALRHAAIPPDAPPKPFFEVENLHVDLARRRVLLDRQELHLTPTEYKLLAALVRRAGRVVTHRQLLHEVWGANYVSQTHYLRVYMAQLRHKVERDPARPRLITTEPGVGYRLMEEVHQEAPGDLSAEGGSWRSSEAG
jgi:two-component system KDP operon response regulator KdpE